MMTLSGASRRYVVMLEHSCGHTSPASAEVSAHSLTDLLRLLHNTQRNELTCSQCGPTGMSVQSIKVILEEDALTERLGAFANELLPAH